MGPLRRISANWSLALVAGVLAVLVALPLFIFYTWHHSAQVALMQAGARSQLELMPYSIFLGLFMLVMGFAVLIPVRILLRVMAELEMTRKDLQAEVDEKVSALSQAKAAADALVESESRYRLLAENASDVIWMCDVDLQPCYLSPAVERIFGYTPEQFIREFETIAPHVIPEIKRIASDAASNVRQSTQHESLTLELALTHKNGTKVWTETDLTILRNDSGVLEGLLGVTRDISERKRAEDNRRVQTSAINAATDQIIITDTQGAIEYVNSAFESETGYLFNEVVGRNSREFLDSSDESGKINDSIASALSSGYTWRGELISRRKDGTISIDDVTITPVTGPSGNIEHYISIKRDITEGKLYEQQLDYLAHHDTLTGLPNRLLFSEHLTHMLLQLEGANEQVAVMFLDLDGFKLINDTLGHNVGDSLLRRVADRLGGIIRDSDLIARMGGDEFTMIVGDVHSPEGAATVAKRVLEILAEPFNVNGRELFLSASMGISLYPTDGDEVEALVRNADAAMYRAKERGRNSYEFYTASMGEAAAERMVLANALPKAVERGEFVLHYQPLVDINTGEISGAEALIRWLHPDMGLILPGVFIPLAEETGLIEAITDWVAHTAIERNKAWQDAGLSRITISVNVPAHQFQDLELRHMVERILNENALDPQYLDLEITERGLMQNPDVAVEVLRAFKNMGVKISVDDFGTGYSSLSYLKRFPLDTVKIDHSFVQDLTTDPDAAAIAGAVVAMAHSLNLKVVAEGVETLEQLEFLRSLRCDKMQGYFISRPVSEKEFVELLREEQNSKHRKLKAA